MNNKGQTMFYGICLALVIIILALALSPALKEQVDTAMNVTVGDTIGMDCENVSVDNFTKAGCTVVDFSIFYFIFGLILIAGGVALAKVLT